MLVLLHALLAASALALLARQFLTPRRGRLPVLLVSGGLGAALITGLALMVRQGGLAQALFFGHAMHWLGWLAVLTWLHAVVRRRATAGLVAAGLPLLLTLAASAAGLLSLIQERI